MIQNEILIEKNCRIVSRLSPSNIFLSLAPQINEIINVKEGWTISLLMGWVWAGFANRSSKAYQSRQWFVVIYKIIDTEEQHELYREKSEDKNKTRGGGVTKRNIYKEKERVLLRE